MNTYKRICLMIPTYKRPEKLKECIDSALLTVSDKAAVVFSFCVNKTDTVTQEFLNNFVWPENSTAEITYENSIQPNLSLYYNLMYNNTQYKDAVVTEIGDDMIFKTGDWDKKILKAINDSNGFAIVHCDDDYIAHDKCCVNLFVTRELVEATKKPFMCEFFHADMIDMVWKMVGEMTCLIKYLGDVIIYHNHSTRKENTIDETFARLRPIQVAANKSAGYALAYSTVVARNLIESGHGKWNTLQ